MDVILKEDVEKVGKAGEKASVSNGYGRNYLIPQGFAIKATPAALKVIEDHMRKRAKRLAAQKADAEKQAVELGKLCLSFIRRSGEDGKLFGSVTAHEIGAGVIAKGFEIDKRKVSMDTPLKSLGEHKVKIKLHPEVAAEITVEVKAEAVEALPEKEKASEDETSEDTAEKTE